MHLCTGRHSLPHWCEWVLACLHCSCASWPAEERAWSHLLCQGYRRLQAGRAQCLQAAAQAGAAQSPAGTAAAGCGWRRLASNFPAPKPFQGHWPPHWLKGAEGKRSHSKHYSSSVRWANLSIFKNGISQVQSCPAMTRMTSPNLIIHHVAFTRSISRKK